MSAIGLSVWDSLFGRDGLLIQTHKTCRISYYGRTGLMIMDEGMIIGGYTDIFFYDDNGSERIRLFGGSLFNSQHEECKAKWEEFKQKFTMDEDKQMQNEQNIVEDQVEEKQIEGAIETEDI